MFCSFSPGHRTIACHVFIFLLVDADRAVFEVFLSTRARGSRCGRNYADNITVFPLLLQVFFFILQFQFINQI
jgi:hypothetical protein